MTDLNLFRVRCLSCNFVLGAKQIPYETLTRGNANLRDVFRILRLKDSTNFIEDHIKKGFSFWYAVLTIFGKLKFYSEIAGDVPTSSELKKLFPLKREIIEAETAKYQKLISDKKKFNIDISKDLEKFQFTRVPDLDRIQKENSPIRFFYAAIGEGLSSSDAMDALGINRICCRKEVISPIQIAESIPSTKFPEELAANIFIDTTLDKIYPLEMFEISEDDTEKDINMAIVNLRSTDSLETTFGELKVVPRDNVKEKEKNSVPRYSKKRIYIVR